MLQWKRLVGPVALAAIGTLALACGEGSKEAAPPANPPAAQPAPAQAPAAAPAGAPDAGAADEAKQIFATRCFTCHGTTGEGNGPASAGLTPPPRNFHDKTWQGSVTDDHIRQIVQYGGAAVGKSPAMPANPDLMSKPAVVDGLLAIVRGFGR